MPMHQAGFFGVYVRIQILKRKRDIIHQGNTHMRYGGIIPGNLSEGVGTTPAPVFFYHQELAMYNHRYQNVCSLNMKRTQVLNSSCRKIIKAICYLWQKYKRTIQTHNTQYKLTIPTTKNVVKVTLLLLFQQLKIQRSLLHRHRVS